MAYGLGGFLYDVVIDGKTASFKFTDPEDVTNVAEVAVSEKEFPSGTVADSREVADYAFSLISKQLNEKRDARISTAAGEQAKAIQAADAQTRADTADFHKNARDNVVLPTTTEKREDGTVQNVFNSATPDASTDQPKKK